MKYDPSNVNISIGGKPLEGFSEGKDLVINPEVVYVRTADLSKCSLDHPDYSNTDFLVHVCDGPLSYSFKLSKNKYPDILEEFLLGKEVHRDYIKMGVTYED